MFLLKKILAALILLPTGPLLLALFGLRLSCSAKSRRWQYGGDTVDHYTLQRLRYGAHLARESRLPFLVTAGASFGSRAEADSMREVLEKDFGIKVRWAETTSRDTAENASMSAAMLKAAGMTRVALVSHGWHLPRVIRWFEKQGLEVTQAPTAFSTGSPSLIENFLPSGINRSRHALNEYLGQSYNRLKE